MSSNTLSKYKITKVASQPRQKFIDCYNSSATGHQIADNAIQRTTLWRESRSMKLKRQFKMENVVKVVTEAVIGNDRPTAELADDKNDGKLNQQHQNDSTKSLPNSNLIFKDCVIYLNASTGSSGISDIELKRLLSAHGAQISIHVARKRVTHVILTDPSTAGRKERTIGGGLSARKIQKEIDQASKNKIKHVTVNWVLDSIKAGKKLPESRYSSLLPLNHKQKGILQSGFTTTSRLASSR